jgi:hypothetical protein
MVIKKDKVLSVIDTLKYLLELTRMTLIMYPHNVKCPFFLHNKFCLHSAMRTFFLNWPKKCPQSRCSHLITRALQFQNKMEPKAETELNFSSFHYQEPGPLEPKFFLIVIQKWNIGIF